MVDERPAIDPAVLDTLRQLNEEGQPDVVREVLELFLADTPSRVAAVEAAVQLRDATGLQRSAHTLKGASGSIGATALQLACRALEDMGKQRSFDDVDAGVDTMRREYLRVREAIKQLL